MTDTDGFRENPHPSSVAEGMGDPNPPSVIVTDGIGGSNPNPSTVTVATVTVPTVTVPWYGDGCYRDGCYHGDSALVVELWLHRVADDTSGLTFQEWDPSAGTDDGWVPVATLVNSRELRAAEFPLTEVRPLHLDAVTLGGRRTRGRDRAPFLV